MEEVAGEAGAEVEGRRFYLEEIDSSLWTPFLASQQGDLVGPVPWNDQFALFAIRNKSLPSVADSELLSHAEAALLRARIEQEVNKRVTWHKRL